jgi:membrane-associated phospholipid phosphatase
MNKRRERGFLGEYACRTTRGYLVGTPSLLVFQSLLGSDRPSSGNARGSYWHPFYEDHAVSGHSFIGAIPFITAAQMVEKPWQKGVFYACSMLTAWSRVNDNQHYLSQAVLGWYLAYLSVRSVSQTEGTRLPKGLTIFPVTEDRCVGIGFLYKR